MFVYPPVDGDKERALLQRALDLFDHELETEDVHEWLVYVLDRIQELNHAEVTGRPV